MIQELQQQSEYELREYQIEAVESVLRMVEDGVRNILVVMPTGTGKTVVFSEIAKEMFHRTGLPVMVIAHRDELIRQAVEKLEQFGCYVEVEKAEEYASNDVDVVVASIQTLTRRADRRFRGDQFSMIIVDEAHHVLAASYQKVLSLFRGVPVLGVTATPDRSDKSNLGQFFDAVAYEYTIADAVRDGFLCDIIAHQLPVEVDISKAATIGGDIAEDDAGEAVDCVTQAIADHIAPFIKNEHKTLIFTPLVKNAISMSEALKKNNVNAYWVSGDHPDRHDIVKSFRDGEITTLVNAMLLTEGFDCPDISCIVPLRPTKSRSLYVQMIGRGTRITEGKERLLVLDPLWIAGKHRLCEPTVLLSGKPEVREKTRQLMYEKGESLFEAFKDATDSYLKHLQNSGTPKTFSLIDAALILNDHGIVTYEPVLRWEKEPPTEKQIAFLQRNNIVVDPTMTRGHASRIITTIMARHRAGMPTIRQISFLRRNGLPVPATKAEASKLIEKKLAQFRMNGKGSEQ